MPSTVSQAYPHLFSEYSLRGLTLRNRAVVSGHFAGWWVDRGLPSQAFVDYLEERARGGVGLFVIGATSPKPGSGWMENLSDAIVPRYRALVEAGHRHGTAVFAQLCHPGFRPLPGPGLTGDVPTAPRTQPSYRGPDRHVPDATELADLVAAFGAAAGRAAAGGVDGIELHSHESFLHAQMLNPLWNSRDDEYGGSLENRMRFMVETLRAMRRAAGDTLPIGVRLKLDDCEQRGMPQDEYLEVARSLEAAGLVDYLSVTGGDGPLHHGPMPRHEGEWLPMVERLRAATRLTLMHAGHIATPEMAEAALADGRLDLVCLTKSHICDPHFTRKALEGRANEIRFCTRCLQSCHGRMNEMTCVYNPVTSREGTWARLHPAEPRKRVVIVGAGPAGMEAAVTAADRGHEVIVLDRSDQIGGQVIPGGGSPLRRNWLRIADYYRRQADRGIFEVRLNTDATAETVVALRPDCVLIATGSRPIRLEIHGGPAAVTVHEAIAGALDAARSIVLFDQEGFNRSLVVADALSDRGIAVEIVTPFGSIWPQVESMMRDEVLDRLVERSVRYWPAHSLEGWDAPGVVRLRNVRTCEERTLDGIDAVVAAVGSVPVTDLASALRNQVPELYVIGDAVQPDTVEQATYHGGMIARKI